MLLRAVGSEEVFECAGNTFIGRGLVDGLNIDSRQVSSLHAVITWHMGRNRWLLHDLGSRNGTRVNTGGGDARHAVEPGKATPLQVGMRVFFAQTGFVVDDAAPPPARAVSLSTGEVRVASDGLLMLPDDRSPDVVLIDIDDGWLVRDAPADASSGDSIDRGTKLPEAETLVTASGRTWRLWRPHATPDTRVVAYTASSYAYEVIVSPDGESVRLVLRGPKDTIVLPPRRHHELIWLLARAWHQDAERPLADRGWRDTSTLSAQMALTESTYIGVLLFRFRSQLRKRGIADADELIERRNGQLRLAPIDIRIIDQGRAPTD